MNEQPDPNLTDLFDTRNHGSQRLSARYEHTRDVLVTRTHTHTQRETRDKRPDSPATHSRTGGEINVVLQQQRMVRV